MTTEKNDDIQRKETHEYFLLGGILYRHWKIYNGTFPDPDSWIWDYYPHGNFWKAKLKAAAAANNLEEAWIW